MRALFALLLSLFASDALAQWQVPDRSVPIGRGPGFTGFRNAAPGAAGLPLVSQGASADPAFRQPASAANKMVYVSTAGNDANDGLSWGTAKLTIQAGIDTASTAGKVFVGVGTYTLSAPLNMRASVALECIPGATITQGNSANLVSLVNFVTNTATGASIRYCTIDGNRDNNTNPVISADSGFLIVITGVNDVVIDNNILRNGPSYGVIGTAQTNFFITNNIITNTALHPIQSINSPGGFIANCKIVNNIIAATGRAGILIAGLDGCVIHGNTIKGVLIGGPASQLHVSTSGTTVTWQSGPNFSAVKVGMALVINDGQEFVVTQVNSTTVLTVHATPGTLTNVFATIGTGDLLGVAGAGQTIVSNNHVSTNTTFGLALYDSTLSQLVGLIVTGNIMEANGKNGLSLGNVASGVGVRDVTIVGNQVIDALQGRTASCASANTGCRSSYIVGGATIVTTQIDSNFSIVYASFVDNWLALQSVVAAGVYVGPGNVQTGAINTGVFGGISSITLSAGWGNTAAASAIISYGHSASFTITANGTGIAANPTFTVNTSATKPGQGAVAYICKQVGGTGAITTLSGEQNSTVTQIGAITFNGTPVAASTYIIQCQ
jgi:hypothetical protein